MSGILFVVSGPSGVGKSTMCSRLREEFPSIEVSTSVTSRAPRHNEVDGVDYDFVDVPTFKEMIERDEFVEWAQVHGNYYGTTRRVVEAQLQAASDVLFDIDYQGADGIRAAYPRAVTVMLLPPSYEALEGRLRGRKTDAEDVIQRRLENARGEIEHVSDFDYVIVNEDLDRAYDQLRAIFVAARCRPWELREVLSQRLNVIITE